jgi:hypothetical protein
MLELSMSGVGTIDIGLSLLYTALLALAIGVSCWSLRRRNDSNRSNNR